MLTVFIGLILGQRRLRTEEPPAAWVTATGASRWWRLWDSLRSRLSRAPSCPHHQSPVHGGSRKQGVRQGARDCKGIKTLLGIRPSGHRSKEVFWNLRLSCLSSLLSCFFAVPVSSTLGILSLPLCWVLLTFSFHRRSFRQVGLLLCLASSLQGSCQGCLTQVKYESGHHRCRGSV